MRQTGYGLPLAFAFVIALAGISTSAEFDTSRKFSAGPAAVNAALQKVIEQRTLVVPQGGPFEPTAILQVGGRGGDSGYLNLVEREHIKVKHQVSDAGKGMATLSLKVEPANPDSIYAGDIRALESEIAREIMAEVEYLLKKK